MNSRVLSLVIGCVALTALDARAQTAMFLVRHAEKVDESRDAALSAAGLARAESLARHLQAAGITAIYTTAFQRTIKTAEPLARRLKLAMTSADTPPADLMRMIQERAPQGAVLVVGHSNTVPEMLSALGYPTPVQIAAEEFDNLFVVVPRPGGTPTVLRLKY